MHVLIVTQYFWPENFRINDLAMGFLKEVVRLPFLPGYPITLMVDFFRLWLL